MCIFESSDARIKQSHRNGASSDGNGASSDGNGALSDRNMI
ncbi:MAG: hypothetical protein Q4A09_01315 [Capnocytophaga felis]|nr:hypothetical protein [Capnocytophaga felis]